MENRFIVIEGLDGAGKSTQLKLITDYYASCGIECRSLHFPRFDAPVYGDLIARFLRGELGAIDAVDPRLVALIYAGDRADAADMLRRWLNEGYAVILDRYVYSNIAYQCAKVADKAKRDLLADWIFDLEYGYNAIPRPDLSIFLDVPLEFTRRKLEENRDGYDRGYLNGKRDIHESSLAFQERVHGVYLDRAVTDPALKVINCCADSDTMLPAEEIFSKISSYLTCL